LWTDKESAFFAAESPIGTAGSSWEPGHRKGGPSINQEHSTTSTRDAGRKSDAACPEAFLGRMQSVRASGALRSDALGIASTSGLKKPITEQLVRNPYEVLGMQPTATAAEIQKAYRKLAKKLHPDLSPGDKSAEVDF
jgi:hypothetical protein